MWCRALLGPSREADTVNVRLVQHGGIGTELGHKRQVNSWAIAMHGRLLLSVAKDRWGRGWLRERVNGRQLPTK